PCWVARGKAKIKNLSFCIRWIGIDPVYLVILRGGYPQKAVGSVSDLPRRVHSTIVNDCLLKYFIHPAGTRSGYTNIKCRIEVGRANTSDKPDEICSTRS